MGWLEPLGCCFGQGPPSKVRDSDVVSATAADQRNLAGRASSNVRADGEAGVRSGGKGSSPGALLPTAAEVCTVQAEPVPPGSGHAGLTPGTATDAGRQQQQDAPPQPQAAAASAFPPDAAGRDGIDAAAAAGTAQLGTAPTPGPAPAQQQQQRPTQHEQHDQLSQRSGDSALAALSATAHLAGTAATAAPANGSGGRPSHASGSGHMLHPDPDRGHASPQPRTLLSPLPAAGSGGGAAAAGAYDGGGGGGGGDADGGGAASASGPPGSFGFSSAMSPSTLASMVDAAALAVATVAAVSPMPSRSFTAHLYQHGAGQPGPAGGGGGGAAAPGYSGQYGMSGAAGGGGNSMSGHGYLSTSGAVSRPQSALLPPGSAGPGTAGGAGAQPPFLGGNRRTSLTILAALAAASLPTDLPAQVRGCGA